MALYTSFYARQLALAKDEQDPASSGPDSIAQTRQSVIRRTVDLNGPILEYREAYRLIDSPTHQQTPQLRGTPLSSLHMLPPSSYIHLPFSNAAIKFACVAPSKTRSSVNASVWFPDGRRCLTATQAGEFCMWGGQTFHFETIIQAHETPIRDIVFTRNGNFLVSGDDAGNVRYWKPNLELIKSTQAHEESVRRISFSRTDLKFATASDDSTVKVWDFARVASEHVLAGHGGDVKSVDWHPHSSLLVSGSKDAIVKLWDARSGKSAGTMHGHKATITATKWNPINGNWILTSSRDQTCKIYDVRMQSELATFVGHGTDITQATWHPLQEDLFVSGGHDGSMAFWLAGRSSHYLDKVPGAHDGTIFTCSWNPSGHLLVSGGGDTSIKFWCRARPGDPFLQQQLAAQASVMESADHPPSNPAIADSRAPRDPRAAFSMPTAIPGIGGNATQPKPPPPPREPPKVQPVVSKPVRTNARIQQGKATAVAVGRGRATSVRGGVKKVPTKKKPVVAARRK
jgi:polyadenylation factor subunit 2